MQNDTENGDGEDDDEEIVDALQRSESDLDIDYQIQKFIDDMVEQIFKQFDVDHSNVLEADEAVQFLKTILGTQFKK